MVSSTRSLSSRWLSAALACVMSVPAFAEPSEAEKSARAHVAASQQFFNLGKFEPALAELEEAYKLKAAPGLLFNIAQCHRQLKHYERAAFFYKAYAEAGTGPQVEVAKTFAQEMLALDTAEKEQAHAAEVKAEQARAEEARREQEKVAKQRELDLELARLAANRAQADVPAPIFKKWWFWTGVAVIAAGTTVAVVATRPQPRPTTLGEASFR